jgi:hypothetical protein
MKNFREFILEEKTIPIFQLNKSSIKKLEKVFPRIHPDVPRSYHVTYSIERGEGHDESKFEVVGTMDRDSVQALVVKVGGQLKRPDGLIYHITWSFDRKAGGRPLQSGELLKKGWVPVKKISFAAFPKQLGL